MSVRLPPDDAWRVIESSHTGILTTLRADGSPITLPVWFVVLDRTICLSAPSRTRKVARVRNDPRASFLVESGQRWAELRAVHVSGSIEIVTDQAAIRRIAAAIDAKYRDFQTTRDAMPTETQAHYRDRTFLRMHPHDRILSWDNARIELSRG